jgi:hypothetical protein
MDTVALGKAFRRIGPVLPNALHDITRHADIHVPFRLLARIWTQGSFIVPHEPVDPRFREGDGGDLPTRR